MKSQHAIETEEEKARQYGRELGVFLRARREELGLSQEEIALRAGMDRRHYQELEYGFSNSRTRTPANPGLLRLIKLADALDMDVEEFLACLGSALTSHRR